MNNILRTLLVDFKEFSWMVKDVDVNSSFVISEVDVPEELPAVPIRVPFLLIVLIREGELEIGIDLQDCRVGKDTMVVLHPGCTITRFEQPSPCRLWAIIREPDDLVQLTPLMSKVLPYVISTDFRPYVEFTSEEVLNIESWFRLLKRKSMEEGQFHHEKMILLFEAFHLDLFELRLKHISPIKKTLSRKEELMSKFLMSISSNFRQHREVSFYAGELCVSPKHLGTIVKEISGRTPAYWINLHVRTEAQILIKSTDKTIQEIADLLNFPSQSHFGKYFRNQTGQSPTQYRGKR